MIRQDPLPIAPNHIIAQHRRLLKTANHPTAGSYARRVFRHLLIFVLILILLRRFTGIQVSIVGSVVLTVFVSLVVSRLDGWGD